MADIWYDVDTALSEVPINILPLLDDTDFKTQETSVAYNASGMALKWNFCTTAGAYTQTAVTPTTSGTYDWAHQGGGMYSIEIPASGGASINNDTEGFGWFSGVATGVLPWRGPICGFRAAALNDALIDSTTGLLGSAQVDFNCLSGSTTTAIKMTTGSYSTTADEFSSRFLIRVTTAEMRTVTASSDTAGTTSLTVAAFGSSITTGEAFILVGSSVASR